MNRFVMSGSVGVRRRRPAKAESEKRTGQARRRRFIKVAQEQRLGLPRRKRDCPPAGMGTIVTDEPLAACLARPTQTNVPAIDTNHKRSNRGS
jgi:hypothetical protein